MTGSQIVVTAPPALEEVALDVSAEQQEKALALLWQLRKGRCVAGACVLAGISRSTYYRWIKHSPEFELQVQQMRWLFVFDLEDAVFRAADRGDWRAALAFLQVHDLSRDRWAAPGRVRVRLS
jgi:hypothetical protein